MATSKTLMGGGYKHSIDIISGGFPCQPWSKAGKQKGAADDRHLWPEMLRSIREIEPRWVVGENVTGIKSMALDMVLASLEDSGYQTESYIIPASAVGAWHRRERIWIIAHNSRNGLSGNKSKEGSDFNKKRAIISKDSEPANVDGPSIQGYTGYEYSEEQWKRSIGRNGQSYWAFPWPQIASSFCRNNDGISNRMDRIKSLGNAIVPQVVFEIFKAIQHMEDLNKKA